MPFAFHDATFKRPRRLWDCRNSLRSIVGFLTLPKNKVAAPMFLIKDNARATGQGAEMAKIKSNEEYRKKLGELNEEGVHVTEHASERQKRLEGETAAYADKLRHRETKGRPETKTRPRRGREK